MKIICDTNVWYKSKNILKNIPSDHELIFTATNLYDFYASPKMDKKHPNHKDLLDAYKTARSISEHTLLKDPWDFIVEQLFPNYKYKIASSRTIQSLKVAEKCLEDIVDSKHYNDLQINEIREKLILKKYQFVCAILKNIELLKFHCIERYKSNGAVLLKKKCLASNIKIWLRENLVKMLSKNNTSVENYLDDINNYIEVSAGVKRFIDIYFHFLNGKPESPAPNSLVDLVNFFYLIEEDYVYWTEEKEFIELVYKSYKSLIPSFMYPKGIKIQEVYSPRKRKKHGN